MCVFFFSGSFSDTLTSHIVASLTSHIVVFFLVLLLPLGSTSSERTEAHLLVSLPSRLVFTPVRLCTSSGRILSSCVVISASNLCEFLFFSIHRRHVEHARPLGGGPENGHRILASEQHSPRCEPFTTTLIGGLFRELLLLVLFIISIVVAILVLLTSAAPAPAPPAQRSSLPTPPQPQPAAPAAPAMPCDLFQHAQSYGDDSRKKLQKEEAYTARQGVRSRRCTRATGGRAHRGDSTLRSEHLLWQG
jgi:hypothetical protein